MFLMPKRLEFLFGRRSVVVAAYVFGAFFVSLFFLIQLALGTEGDATYARTFLVLYPTWIMALGAALFFDRKELIRTAVGHAATAICFQKHEHGLYSYLILNENHNLWLTPGGHLDIVFDEPYRVAKGRILEELGYQATVVESRAFETARFKDFEILHGCHALYRLRLPSTSCHTVHVDFAFVCELTDRAVPIGQSKYKALQVEVGDCSSSGDVGRRVREVVHRFYQSSGLDIPASPYPGDLPDRIYLGLRYYREQRALEK
jgi:hypothetical protein